ncbi:endonuclease domain-containing protein [Rhizorhabdus argentea]|uniref:endonuclease domain-containing protein n=1 Tax=Rhizorhabdus argentea TaxID=1387174 RepID=UPI0030EB2D27
MQRPPGVEPIERLRSLRTFSTDAEKRLWSRLRGRRLEEAKFRRQVWLGNYIVDFVRLDRRLVIEADGGQHAEQQEYDHRRTAFLAQQGYRVLRFWNNDVRDNLDGVLTSIMNALKEEPSPSHACGAGPSLSPAGRGFL